MKKLLGVVCVLAVALLSSCDLLASLFGDDDEGSSDPSYGNFWAQNTSTGNNYRVDADLIVSGKHCDVWVEKGKATAEQARMVADEYDDVIYNMMIEIFSVKNFKTSGKTFSNILEYADWLTNNDGKLCILLLDIKDSYGPNNSSYVAGYFHGIHFLDGSYSNQKDMIFIDTYPAMENTKEAFSTLAHELQHLMNLATTFYIRAKRNEAGKLIDIFPMDTWIDEGLASAAEYLYQKGHLENRIDWYVYNGFKESKEAKHRGLIDKGNNFFVWDNRENENQYAVMDDYATVYLFFQWLRIQAGRSTIYSEIIASNEDNYLAVTNVINAAVPGQSFSNWDVLLKTWLAANYINSTTGIYGYKNDTTLRNLKVPAPNSISSLISLAQGEGVYSRMGNSFSMPTSTTNIKYASLSKDTAAVDNIAANGRVLLTYNANTTLEKDRNQNYISVPGTGTTTGTPITASVNTVSADRSAMPAVIRPYRIDARDMLKQDPLNVDQLLKLGNKKE